MCPAAEPVVQGIHVGPLGRVYCDAQRESAARSSGENGRSAP